MKTQTTTNPYLLRKMGLDALSKSLGPIGMVRFLRQYETGTGDYTKERAKWLKNIDIDSLAFELKNRRKKKTE